MKKAAEPKCVRCGKPTCRAHLLPQGFTRRVRGDNKNLAQIFRHKTGEKFSQSSIYDTDILCAECDAKIGKLDDYALEFCKKFKAKKHLLKTHFFVPNVSTDKLVRFVASVIWRCAVSSRPETAQIDLEAEIDIFGDIVFDEKTSPVLYPQVVVMRCLSEYFTDVEHFCGLPALTTSPFAPNDKFFALHLGGFRWVVRIDRTDWPKSLRPTPINGQSLVTGAFINFDASPEFQDIKQWLLRNHLHKVEKQKKFGGKL